MKKMTLLAAIWMIVTFGVLAAGCLEGSNDKVSTPVDESQLRQVETPIWSEEDVEVEKQKGRATFVYRHEIYDQPPFYNGPLPLRFDSLDQFLGINEKRILAHDFEEFINCFIYQDFILVGARTYDRSHEIIAEARIRYFVTDENEQGVEADEFHYQAGKPVFKCKSRFNPYNGHKLTETEAIGQKTRDYYFILPLGYLGR